MFISRARFLHLYNRLLAGDENPVSIEVISHLDSQNVRGISLVPTQGLARGQRVLDTGRHFHVPVGETGIGTYVQRLW
jgi:F-type H+/Na+-transporting ATPase subunit beta